MSNTVKRQKLIEKVERMMGRGTEPALSADNYRSSLIHALNYYNANNDDKDKKKWFLAYIATTDKKLAVAMNKLDEDLFRHGGIIARMHMREEPLQEKELTFLEERVKVLTKLVDNPEEAKQSRFAVAKDDKPAAPIVSLQERISDKAHELAGEIDGMIDDFILEDKTFDAKEILKRLNASGPVAKVMSTFWDSTIAELEEVLEGKDKQLVEGYSHLKKAKIKKFLALVESIKEACGNQVKVAKATRKPRARKEKPASVIVAKMKFKKEDTEYGIKSISAASIVNAQELWVFNTKYRKVQVYRADDAKGLSVKGTSIIGFDVEKSGSKMMRKAEQIMAYPAMGKREINNAFKALTTMQQKVNGRINEECVLLKVF
jgi:hypothetical protein